ncbi:hypothetical protein D1159_12095 [Pseudoflavonifractor sp. 524-17]|uniref:hypothetical protein n=1 Tax=Pseudoflavonifractor sp. 524-17 TaxID=2304577 RepID=UPI0013796AEF|nr:hypothetical protein [Pseudoflavonifractor sp. 524-17]NCE65299.1 hypothetical protein [Pseudoflavonifractor sp. 524-17]
MASYTPNCGLHQWVGTDKFLRSDFNGDFAKIDTAIGGIQTSLAQKADKTALSQSLDSVSSTLTGIHAALSQKADKASTEQAISALQARSHVIVGYYIGDDARTRVIPLGFTPKAVWVYLSRGISNSNGYGGLAVTGSPAGNETANWVEIVPGGFQVAEIAGTAGTNTGNWRYNYIAVQ